MYVTILLINAWNDVYRVGRPNNIELEYIGLFGTFKDTKFIS